MPALPTIHLTKSDARKIIVNAAGLARTAQFGMGAEAVYRLIDHLDFVLLDTNYVVERAHHQVMWSRVPDYELVWLNELREDGRIYEYFTSDAGFIPMHDFRFSIQIKSAFGKRWENQTKAEAQLAKHVL